MNQVPAARLPASVTSVGLNLAFSKPRASRSPHEEVGRGELKQQDLLLFPVESFPFRSFLRLLLGVHVEFCEENIHVVVGGLCLLIAQRSRYPFGRSERCMLRNLDPCQQNIPCCFYCWSRRNFSIKIGSGFAVKAFRMFFESRTYVRHDMGLAPEPNYRAAESIS